MRQVNREELEWLLFDGMRGLSATTRNMLVSRDAEQQRKGRKLVAAILADKLGRLEILSAAPEPPGWDYYGGDWNLQVSPGLFG